MQESEIASLQDERICETVKFRTTGTSLLPALLTKLIRLACVAPSQPMRNLLVRLLVAHMVCMAGHLSGNDQGLLVDRLDDVLDAVIESDDLLAGERAHMVVCALLCVDVFLERCMVPRCMVDLGTHK